MVCGEIDGFTIYIFFSVKVKGRVKGRMKKLSTCSGRAQTNHQLKRTARPSSLPTEVADKAPAMTTAATVSAMSKQTVGVGELPS
jgi:septal ring-binding cell division protein DamX